MATDPHPRFFLALRNFVIYPRVGIENVATIIIPIIPPSLEMLVDKLPPCSADNDDLPCSAARATS